jgi:hypothetical protein
VTTYTFRIVVEPDEDRWRAYAPALEAQGRLDVGLYARGSAREYPRGSGDDCR